MAVLTDTKARHIKPDDKPLPHGELLTDPSSFFSKGAGEMGFSLCKSGDTKRRNAGLGTYPEVSIAEAARTARIMREQLAAGDDPLRLKRLNLRKSLSQHLPMQPGVYMQNCLLDGKIQSM